MHLNLHDLFAPSYFDLILIFLGFFAGFATRWKEELYLTLFILRLLSWSLKVLPAGKKLAFYTEVETSVDKVLSRLMNKHHLKHDSQVPGVG